MATVDQGPDLVGDPLALGVGADVEERLAPVLVVDDLARGVAQQQVRGPVALGAGLGLEGVHVADVVQPGRRGGVVVAGDDLDAGRRGVGASDLVVEADVGGGQGHGRGLRRVRLHEQRAREGDDADGCADDLPWSGVHQVAHVSSSMGRGHVPASDAWGVLATRAGLAARGLHTGWAYL